MSRAAAPAGEGGSSRDLDRPWPLLGLVAVLAVVTARTWRGVAVAAIFIGIATSIKWSAAQTVVPAAVALLLGRLAARARARTQWANVSAKAAERSASPQSEATLRQCPICSSVLEPGERVKSKLFPGRGDRIMHIFGCVHCWPASVSSPGVSSPTTSAPRICPACGATLAPEAWVTARYFERPAVPGLSPGRRHVHVLGCASCRRK